MCLYSCVLKLRLTSRSTRTDTLFPDTTLCRSLARLLSLLSRQERCRSAAGAAGAGTARRAVIDFAARFVSYFICFYLFVLFIVNMWRCADRKSTRLNSSH